MSDLGKVAITIEEEWDSASTYEALTIVPHDGATYISKINVPAGAQYEPSEENTTYWQLVAKNGEDGQDGSSGHIILDDDETAYTQRSKLKFVNCTITDDSTNDMTIVEAEGGGGGSSSSYIRCTTENSSWYGQTVTATHDTLGNTYTATFSNEGVATITVSVLGDYTVSIDDTSESVSVTAAGTAVAVELNPYEAYAFYYSENDSSPDSVTYPTGYSNSGWTDTAYTDLATGQVHLGAWGADRCKWLVHPRPCMLYYDGTVAYYLDENDYTKKADGTASDITNTAFNGNAMIEWNQNTGDKLIYWKIVPNGSNGFTFVVANKQLDSSMMPWNHYNIQNNTCKHWYTPIFFGGYSGTDTSKMRSLSGLNNYVSQNRTTEITAARANNTTSNVIWDTETYVDWLFQAMILTLMSKSLDGQSKWGHGNVSTSAALVPGTMNDKGLWFGSDDNSSGVKCFGAEHPWGNTFRAVRGLINDNGTIKAKLTSGRQDGSTVADYNLDGSGYLSLGSAPSASGYISNMTINTKGIVPKTVSGSASTYYADYIWINNSQVDYAVVGGLWDFGLHCGPWCVNLGHAASAAHAGRGAALSCKPLA